MLKSLIFPIFKSSPFNFWGTNFAGTWHTYYCYLMILHVTRHFQSIWLRFRNSEMTNRCPNFLAFILKMRRSLDLNGRGVGTRFYFSDGICEASRPKSLIGYLLFLFLENLLSKTTEQDTDKSDQSHESEATVQYRGLLLSERALLYIGFCEQRTQRSWTATRMRSNRRADEPTKYNSISEITPTCILCRARLEGVDFYLCSLPEIL